MDSFEVQDILVLAFWSPNDSVDKYDPWKIVVENATVDDSFPELFDFEGDRDIIEDGVKPAADLLPCGLRVSRFVHSYEVYELKSTVIMKNHIKSN